MIINSPVGRFPYEITGVSVRGTTMEIHGRMGTWPASVEVTPADVPALLRRASPVLGLVVSGAVAGLLWRARSRQ